MKLLTVVAIVPLVMFADALDVALCAAAWPSMNACSAGVAACDSAGIAAQIRRMHVEQLLELVRTQPFEPFCLVMANGERLSVPHEDFIWIMPNRRVVQVALPNGASRWVNLQLVAGLEGPLSTPKGSGKKRKRAG